MVTLLSTMHSVKGSESTTKNKHEIIEYYNSTKGGVDTMDEMTQCYSTKRMTYRRPMVIFFNMLDVSSLNAIIIWLKLQNSFQPKKMVRYTLLINWQNPLLAYNQKRTHPLREQFHIQLHLMQKKKKDVTCVLLNETGNSRCTVMIVK